MHTWLNKRLENRPYNINELVENGASVELLKDSAESQSYLVQNDNEKKVIKVYKYGLSEELEFTYKVIKRLNHPAIAKILSYGELSGHAYEIRKYYPSVSFIEKPENFITATVEIADAINELHIENFTSLDIKTENIVISDDSAVIVDVGSFVGFKSDGNTAYTIGYSAPELDEIETDETNCNELDIFGESEVSDYYSLGITIFELLTGVNPFKGFIPTSSNDKKLNADLHNIKLNPQWWFPYFQTGSNICELIGNLIVPKSSKRWGYSEIIEWQNKVNVEVVSNEIRQLNEIYKRPLMYIDEKLEIKNFVSKLIQKWDVEYLFSENYNVNFHSTYLLNKVALFNAYIKKDGDKDVSSAKKASLLMQLYCELCPNDDKVYFEGQVYENLLEFGSFIYDKTISLCNQSRKANVNFNFKNNNDYILLEKAFLSSAFSIYMKKNRGKNAEERYNVVVNSERQLLASKKLYDMIYNLIMIAYAFVGKVIIWLPIPDAIPERNIEIKSIQELGDILMTEMKSIDVSQKLLTILTFQEKISPVFKAWNDSLKLYNTEED